jgi:hypothetical protein
MTNYKSFSELIAQVVCFDRVFTWPARPNSQDGFWVTSGGKAERTVRGSG